MRRDTRKSLIMSAAAVLLGLGAAQLYQQHLLGWFFFGAGMLLAFAANLM